MTQHQKGIFVMDYLQNLGVSIITIGEAIDDRNLEKSYQLIQGDPHIPKEQFLKEMNLIEEA